MPPNSAWPPVKYAPRRGEQKGPAEALEKQNAIVLFKASEGLAERRMGKANRFRSEGEASVLGKRDDLFELRQAEHGPSPEVHAYRSGMLFSLPS